MLYHVTADRMVWATHTTATLAAAHVTRLTRHWGDTYTFEVRTRIPHGWGNNKRHHTLLARTRGKAVKFATVDQFDQYILYNANGGLGEPNWAEQMGSVAEVVGDFRAWLGEVYPLTQTPK